ncbi:2-oxoglutarate carboxylase large subunit [Enhygromyxa salina]|uniref:2-oxoglutarate carboxylase large subunit n=1 Tax=Enhygromyxa salina TaxID=215803 RepID=A0A2S9XDQ7_9BACT|nr:biotin/lipoyl-containing protein [Enhygromyxa salina]PRP90996.1 2-oxoglutarate carboxylase large subunit [Enhygromyxa salina]
MTQRQGYRVRVGEREHEVEIEIDAAGERRILVDGQALEVADAGAHAVRVGPQGPQDARQLELTLAGEPRPSEAWVGVVGARVQVEVRTEQEARLAAALGKGASGSAGGSLAAPMPGRVVKILVSEGEVVELGAPAIIVEAMKMENELHTPSAGVVRRVEVAEGETVDAGQVLIEIEPDPPADE